MKETIDMLECVYEKLKLLNKVDSVVCAVTEFKRIANLEYPDTFPDKKLLAKFQKEPYQLSIAVFHLSGIAETMYSYMDPSSVYNRNHYAEDQISLKYIMEFYESARTIYDRLDATYMELERQPKIMEMLNHIKRQLGTVQTCFGKIDELYRWLSLYY
jgi:hypothetical protein